MKRRFSYCRSFHIPTIWFLMPGFRWLSITVEFQIRSSFIIAIGKSDSMVADVPTM